MGGSPAGLGVISASEKWRDCACTGYFYSHDLKVAATQRQSRQLICRQERRSHRTWRAQFFVFFFLTAGSSGDGSRRSRPRIIRWLCTSLNAASTRRRCSATWLVSSQRSVEDDVFFMSCMWRWSTALNSKLALDWLEEK